MNLLHRRYCRSPEWDSLVRHQLVPWVLDGVELGPHALELGPGPGLTTNQLRHRTGHLSAVEVDRRDAAALAARLADTNVTVVRGDATDLPFADGRFSAVVAMTMLHHVPSSAAQDRLFTETHRVLEPGGYFCGCDSRPNLRWWALHIADTATVLDPRTLPDRLSAVGFTDVAVETTPRRVRFRARRP
ncbi:MAG TPA: class I SAM-dependent methyltransferase [Mycobacteriales bacterium]|nr:class I SAM-dependent methyltransferase [Mycobacteriales bacterium]